MDKKIFIAGTIVYCVVSGIKSAMDTVAIATVEAIVKSKLPL